MIIHGKPQTKLVDNEVTIKLNYASLSDRNGSAVEQCAMRATEQHSDMEKWNNIRALDHAMDEKDEDQR